MKKLLLILLFAISTYSYADVNTEVYNNYILLYSPEYSPHSKLIKKQEIFFDDRPPGYKIVISSNNKGFITFIDYGDNLVSYNYKKKIVYHINKYDEKEDDKTNDIMLLDEKNGITCIKSSTDSSPFCDTTGNYDSQHKIINMSGIEGIRYEDEITYNNNKLVKLINTASRGFCGIGSTSYTKKEFIYDNDNRLIETRYMGDRHVTLCYVANHTKYGDWTTHLCIDSMNGNPHTYKVTRKLQYW